MNLERFTPKVMEYLGFAAGGRSNGIICTAGSKRRCIDDFSTGFDSVPDSAEIFCGKH